MNDYEESDIEHIHNIDYTIPEFAPVPPSAPDNIDNYSIHSNYSFGMNADIINRINKIESIEKRLKEAETDSDKIIEIVDRINKLFNKIWAIEQLYSLKNTKDKDKVYHYKFNYASKSSYRLSNHSKEIIDIDSMEYADSKERLLQNIYHLTGYFYQMPGYKSFSERFSGPLLFKELTSVLNSKTADDIYDTMERINSQTLYSILI